MVEMQQQIRMRLAKLAEAQEVTAAEAAEAAEMETSPAILACTTSMEAEAGAVTAAKDHQELRAATAWRCSCISRQQQPKKGKDYGFYKHR